MKRNHEQLVLKNWLCQNKNDGDKSSDAKGLKGHSDQHETNKRPDNKSTDVDLLSDQVPRKKHYEELETHPHQPANDLPPAQQLSGRKIYFQLKWYHDFPWLHYIPEEKSVFCFNCRDARRRNVLPPSLKIEPAFMDTGYRNWKKALEKFRVHEKSEQHLTALAKSINLKSENIETKLSAQAVATFKQNRQALHAICSSLKFLARQGIAIQGRLDTDGNFMELLRLRGEDLPILRTWQSRSKHYTSHDIRNELLDLMAKTVQRKLIKIIKDSKLYSIIVDETTDASTKEQMSLSIRIVDHEMKPQEYFMGLYEMDSTTGESLANAIQDCLRRFDLPMDNLRGQCFDGASNMRGKFKGVQSRIREVEPRAIYVHCLNHSLNLALQDSVRNVTLMRDVLHHLNDAAVLIGRSAKRLSMFGEVAREMEYDKLVSLKALCPTRWSVRIKAFNSFLTNYPVVLTTLKCTADSNEKSNAVAAGLLKHFGEYETLFGILSLHKFFAPCENLALLLQSPNVSLTGSIEAAKLLINHLKAMNNYAHYEAVTRETDTKATMWELTPPKLPRKRRVPARLSDTLKEPTVFNSVNDYLYAMYEQTLNELIDGLSQRFDQEGLQQFAGFEKMLLKTEYVNSDEGENLSQTYGLNSCLLKHQLEMFRKTAKDTSSVQACISSFKSLHFDVQLILSEVKSLIELLLVVPSSAATAERSFSMLRRIKTYLRSAMTQYRLNHLMTLHAYPDLVDEIDLNVIIQEFVKKCDYRLSVFGKS